MSFGDDIARLIQSKGFTAMFTHRDRLTGSKMVTISPLGLSVFCASC